VFDPTGAEIGVHGITDWIPKHGFTSGPTLPDEVENRLRGFLIDENRRVGFLPQKGQANIKGDSWKDLVRKACP